MDLHYKQEITVGLLVIVALVILFTGLMWLTGRRIGDQGIVEVQVRFEDVSGVTVGDPVHISGVRVGRVSRVRLEAPGRVLVTLEVAESVRPRTDANAAIKSLDFLGSKFVRYDPGTAEEPLPEDRVLDGSEETELASSAGELADRGADVLARLQEVLSPEMSARLQATLEATERALNVIARFGSEPMVDDVRATLGSMRSAAAQLDSTISNPSIDESLNQLDELMVSMNEMAQGLSAATGALGRIMDKIDRAEGSIGQMVNDSTLHQDLHDVLVAMRRLLDDIRERPGRYAPGAIKIF